MLVNDGEMLVNDGEMSILPYTHFTIITKGKHRLFSGGGAKYRNKVCTQSVKIIFARRAIFFRVSRAYFFLFAPSKRHFWRGRIEFRGWGGGRKPQNSKTKTAAKANKKVSVLKALAGTTRGQDQETLLITH